MNTDDNEREQERIANLSPNVQNLVDLKGVSVVVKADVEDLKGNAKSAVLSEQQLKKDVESQLWQNDITVNTGEDRIASEDNGELCVSIRSYSENDFSDIEHNPMSVKVTRISPSPRDSIRIWNSKSLARRPFKSQSSEKVRQDIGKLIDQFIEDYFTANPKK